MDGSMTKLRLSPKHHHCQTSNIDKKMFLRSSQRKNPNKRLKSNSDEKILKNDKPDEVDIKLNKNISNNPSSTKTVANDKQDKKREDNKCAEILPTHEIEANLKDEKVNLVTDITNSIENVIEPKKKYHRRKSSETFKNERIRTRQFQKIIQNKNKYNSLTQTVKCIHCKSDKTSLKGILAKKCRSVDTLDVDTDSEETLSNVESVPNSPAQEFCSKVPGNYSDLTKRHVRLNSNQSNPCQKDTGFCVPKNSIKNMTNVQSEEEVKSTSLDEDPKIKTDDTSNFNNEVKELQQQCYIESSASQNPSKTSKTNTKDVGKHNDAGSQQETPWLRHYERPSRSYAEVVQNTIEFNDDEKENFIKNNRNLLSQKKDIETIENTGLTETVHEGKNSLLKNQNMKNQNLNNRVLRKRGRPLKQNNQLHAPSAKRMKKQRKKNVNSEFNNGSQLAADNNKSHNDENTNEPSVNGGSVLNGSALSMVELQRLFFKFLQHGHFRMDPEQSTTTANDNGTYNNLITRMQCYDPNEYFIPSYNKNFESNTYSHLQGKFQSENDSNKLSFINNSNFVQSDHKIDKITPKLNKFSNEFTDQTTYFKDTTSCNMNMGIPLRENSDVIAVDGHRMSENEMNLWNYNSVPSVYVNSESNYMPNGYITPSNYYQNFYNNNLNITENNFYPDLHSGFVNSDNSMNNTSIGTAAGNFSSTSTHNLNNSTTNFVQNTPNQNSNSMSCGEMDLTMGNGNTVTNSNNVSMQMSFTNGFNPDWNLSDINQQQDSMNELLMDTHLINRVAESNQTMDNASAMKSFMYDPNLNASSSNLWMNNSNNIMNPGFAALSSWHENLPMYKSYNSFMNNDNSYHKNMFNPYAAFTSFDSLYYPYLNTGNNTHPWMQSIFPDIDGNSTTYVSNSYGTDTDFSQENTMNHEMSLSLSSEALSNTLSAGSSFMDSSDTHLDTGHSDDTNTNAKQLSEDSTALIELSENKNMQNTFSGYSKQISVPYSLEHKIYKQSSDLNNVERISTNNKCTENKQQQSLSQIYNYNNKDKTVTRFQSVDNYFNQRYSNPELPYCETIREPLNNKETELSKLRQELANFTRQYSENQTSDTSEFLEENKSNQ